MNNFLITGVSSGIGKTLAETLIKKGHYVWGIARREYLLKDLKDRLKTKRFYFTVMDQANAIDWQLLKKDFIKRKFTPSVIIFNAAISEKDLDKNLNIDSLENIMDVNFLGVMRGIHQLLPIVKPSTQIIAISTFSAFKGSAVEGIGYAASKAALSIGFESLYQKFKDKGILFKTIFFGPISSGMSPFTKKTPFILSEDQAVNFIISSIKGKSGQYYYPKIIFLLIKLIKLLPASLYFKILTIMETVHSKFDKNVD